MDVRAAQLRLIDEVRDALSSSLDLSEVVVAAEPLLRRLVGADYVAIGVTPPGESGGLEWLVADMPTNFFACYAELAPHDFVLRAVLDAPNRVLRDTEMLTRRQLEGNAMYRRSRDLGTPLEQVMSAMIHMEGGYASGISLFRAERRPFTERERDVLQSLLPALRHAVRNCRAFGQATARAALLEDALERQGLSAVIFTRPAHEAARTAGATLLLQRWFRPALGADRLPQALLDWVREVVALPVDAQDWRRVLVNGAESRLVASAYWARRRGGECLVVVLAEQRLNALLPVAWEQRLTKREREITAHIVEGHDNRYIAESLGMSLYTAKTHIGRVFQKLGFDQRAQLIAAAHRLVT